MYMVGMQLHVLTGLRGGSQSSWGETLVYMYTKNKMI